MLIDIQKLSEPNKEKVTTDYTGQYISEEGILLVVTDAGTHGLEAAGVVAQEVIRRFRKKPAITRKHLEDYLKFPEAAEISVTLLTMNQVKIGFANKGTNKLFMLQDSKIVCLNPETENVEEVYVEVQKNCLKERDSFLMTTDGFWKLLNTAEISSDYMKAGSAEKWLSYLFARIGRRLQEADDTYTAVALMAIK